MKLDLKALTLLLSAGVIFSLSGCGSSSSSNNTDTDAEPTTITYIDANGKERTAPATPGDAEVLAGEGYQHTLFDTATDKCQHCHNDLFDTWQSSMHAKSWKDKIFQSKHQDFLRTHLAKIGSSKAEEYTPELFGKVGKTCAKCHAPAAVYSSDYKITLTEDNTTNVSELNATQWADLKAGLESNLAKATGWDENSPATVAGIGADGVLRTATYEIGHKNNREGINCATCHSIETVRMMTDDERDGSDNGQYTLANDIRGNANIGPKVRNAGDTLYYDGDASAENMNIFFKLVGPEKYDDVAHSPHEFGEFDGHTADFNKVIDGRYTFRGIDKDGTDGKTHYTGGPFYGPYGVTGLDNSNEDDDTDRFSKVNPHFDNNGTDGFENHFNENGKALCLSCHQRSAGALVPSGADEGDFMELCSTWTAVSNGSDTNYNDSATSPKCQKCHMPRIEEEFMLHQWGKPETHFTQEFMAANGKTPLTDHFDPNSTLPIEENPVKGQWMNDHSFIGANKLGATNILAKINSGFESTLAVDDTTPGELTITTTFANKTAHMFPGAHPMRRFLTRVTVTNAAEDLMPITSARGKSAFDHVTNSVVSGNSAHVIKFVSDETVNVDYDDGRSITYQGKTPDLNINFEPVDSQKFSGEEFDIIGSDIGTIKDQYTDESVIRGTVTNAEIVTDANVSTFTRIYGRETGKYYNISSGKPAKGPGDGIVYIVRPGFDSNIVPKDHDNRLQPNEIESYEIVVDNLPAGDYNVTYDLYYMQKGANGDFDPSNKTNLITKVKTFTDPVTVVAP